MAVRFVGLTFLWISWCFSCDVCAIPHRVMRVPPVAVMVRAFPLGEGEACLVATGPMLILHETSAAFPRAASRITAIVTILLATFIHEILVGLRVTVPVIKPRQRRPRIMIVCCMQTTVRIVFSCDVCAIPHTVMRVPPVAVMVRAFPLGEGEACLVATGPMLVLHETSAAFPRAASRITAIVTVLLATFIHKILVGLRITVP